MPTVEIVLPRPHQGQVTVTKEAKRFNVLAAGRRWGKDTICEERVIETALAKRPVAWFSPTYKNMLDVWQMLTDKLYPVTKSKSEQEHRLELLTGGLIDMWSLESPDAARGRAYQRVVINEAATIPHLAYAWQQVIRPMLTDFQGDAWFISTPKGLNAFWDLYRLGQDTRYPEWVSWQRPTTENPHIPPTELEQARKDMPESSYRQEFLAEFLEGAGGLFRKVTDAAKAEKQDRGETGHTYVIGVDWAKVQDFTVFTVIDSSLRACVLVDRMQSVDYDIQLGRLEALAARFKPDTIVVERTGQDALIEQLRKTNLPFRPFDTTNQTKKALIDRLILAFENSELSILADPVLIGELQAFQATKLPSGQLRYAAPEGQHDDTVMALALAWSAAVAYPKFEQVPNWKAHYDAGEPRPEKPVVGSYVPR
jgi:hypothetical protein